MPIFKARYTLTEVYDDYIEADSEQAARKMWVDGEYGDFPSAWQAGSRQLVSLISVDSTPICVPPMQHVPVNHRGENQWTA